MSVGLESWRAKVGSICHKEIKLINTWCHTKAWGIHVDFESQGSLKGIYRKSHKIRITKLVTSSTNICTYVRISHFINGIKDREKECVCSQGQLPFLVSLPFFASTPNLSSQFCKLWAEGQTYAVVWTPIAVHSMTFHVGRKVRGVTFGYERKNGKERTKDIGKCTLKGSIRIKTE